MLNREKFKELRELLSREPGLYTGWDRERLTELLSYFLGWLDGQKK